MVTYILKKLGPSSLQAKESKSLRPFSLNPMTLEDEDAIFLPNVETQQIAAQHHIPNDLNPHVFKR
jgi:hypothetical protein